MYRTRPIWIILGIVFLILLIWLIFFHHGPKKQSRKPTQPATVKTLPDYANTTANVSITTDGIVNGDEMHRAIRILISNNVRELDIYQGYNGHVLDFKTFPNNFTAYEIFLKSIYYNGFTSKAKKTNVAGDERGQCPLGYRYILDFSQDGNDLSRTWWTTCGIGTSGASIDTQLRLFQNQIPNYDELTSQVNLETTTTE